MVASIFIGTVPKDNTAFYLCLSYIIGKILMALNPLLENTHEKMEGIQGEVRKNMVGLLFRPYSV